MSKKNNQCCNIGCSKKGSFTCSGCKTEAYCSRECQIGHWAVHKNTCKSKKGSENVVKNESALNYSSLSVKQLKHIIRSKVNGFGDAERKQIISEMNKLSNQEDLVVLAEKHVEKSEIKSLLSTLPDKSNTPGAMMQMQQSRGGGKAKRVQKEEEIDLSKASPSQLRLQAQYLRKNPNLVRKQQPSMAHMSDAEILEAAEQLEQLANNPASMKEFKENWGSLSAEEREMMKNITPEQREQIRNLTPEQKEQIKNISPAQKKEMMKLAHMSPNDKKNLQIFQEGIQGVIDEKWINAVMELLKNKPEIFKTMFKGMGSVTGGEGADDSQVDPYIDFIVGMGEWNQRFLLNLIMYAQMSSKPIMALYAKVDEWTYGNAKHIALLIGGLLLYIVAMVIFYVTRASFKYIYLAFALLYRALYGNGATDVSINGGTIPDSVGVAVDDVSSSTPNVGSGGDEFEF